MMRDAAEPLTVGQIVDRMLVIKSIAVGGSNPARRSLIVNG
jgi:hypothetical protein